MSKPKRTRLNPDDRAQQLLGFAMKAYAEIGIERAGHGDVAKLAGVSTATVFNYFPTRDALTDAVLARIGQKVMELFSNTPQKNGPASEQVLALAKVYAQMTEDNPDLSKVFLNWSVSFASDLRPKYLAFENVLLDQLTKRLSDRPDRTDARIIIGAANMMAMMKLDGKTPDIIERFVQRVASQMDS